MISATTDALGALAGELFEALDDHVAIQRVKLHQECSTAGLDRGDYCRVDPGPPNKSSTFSPAWDEYCIARTASSTGFSVRWTIFSGLIFLMDQTSGTFFGP